MKAKLQIGILLIISSILILAPRAYAITLPQCGSQWGITVCIVNYQIAQDMQHVTLFGSVEQRLSPSGARILAVHGWVYDQQGTVLGSGVISNVPFDLPYGQAVNAQAELQSNFPLSTLGAMNVQSVRVLVVAEYCLPWQFLSWTGCMPMPNYQYEQSLTIGELQALYAYYANQ